MLEGQTGRCARAATEREPTSQRNALGSATKQGESPVREGDVGSGVWYLSTAGHVEPGGNLGGPSSKAKHVRATDSGKYREGKAKRTPGGE